MFVQVTFHLADMYSRFPFFMDNFFLLIILNSNNKTTFFDKHIDCIIHIYLFIYLYDVFFRPCFLKTELLLQIILQFVKQGYRTFHQICIMCKFLCYEKKLSYSKAQFLVIRQVSGQLMVSYFRTLTYSLLFTGNFLLKCFLL